MAVTPISLGMGSNPARAGADGAARFINCYVEDAGEEGKIRFPVYACEGFSSFSTLTSGGVTRAMFAVSSTKLYSVSGTRIFKTTDAGSSSQIGTLSTSGSVMMAMNANATSPQVAVVSSDGLFRVITTSTDTVTTPTQPSGTAFNGVVEHDGYFILTQADGEWYITAINNTTIDELDFTTTQGGIVRPSTRGSEVVMFGPKKTTFYTNTGNTDFPYERSASSSYGCYAAGSVKEIVVHRAGQDATDSIVFAATNPDGAYIGIRMLNGYGAEQISTAAVDRAVLTETTPSNLKASTWSINGHTFYAISGTSFTWVYDVTTGQWHERTSNALSKWRVSDVVQFGTKVICGDYTLGRLYEMTASVYATSDSVVRLYHSNDNGSTYVGPRSKTIGQSTNLTQRFKWVRCGQSKEDGKLLKFEITNAVYENGAGITMTVIPPHVHAWPGAMKINAVYADVIPGSSQNARPKGFTGLAVDAAALRA